MGGAAVTQGRKRVVLLVSKERYGGTLGRAFKPLALKAVRQRMIDRGCCRTSVNKNISRIKLLFAGASKTRWSLPA